MTHDEALILAEEPGLVWRWDLKAISTTGASRI